MKVLVAVDQTEGSRRAGEFVERFFSGADNQITAVNVSEVTLDALPGVPYGGLFAWQWPLPAWPERDPATRGALEAEQERGERIARAYSPGGALPEARIGDDAAEAIGRVAEEHDADLIVVGSNDKGFLDRLLGGSVSEDLARDAPRPVLIVR